MSANEDGDRLLELFDRALSGEASEGELGRLEDLLANDQGARNLYAEYARFGVDLRFGFRTGALLGKAHAPRPVLRPKKSEGRINKHARRGALGALAALAAGLLLAVMMRGGDDAVVEAALPSILRPPAPVATLADHTDALWRGQQLSVGQAIREGSRITLLRGTARISVGAGAEILATAPCDLDFVTPDTVWLHEGEVAVNVAEWATGFRILTDMMEVEDLGTTFTVSASRESGVKTTVIEGQVRAAPSSGGVEARDSVLLTRGEGFSVDGQGRLVGRFTEALTDIGPFDFGGLRPYRPIELHNSGLRLAVGDEDPNWLVVAGPAGHFSGPQQAVLCQPDERYLANEPGVSQWVSVSDGRNARSNSTYTFQTSFRLDGYDVSTVKLFGRFLADNGIKEVRVNGAPVRVDSWADNVAGQNFGQSQFRFVNVTDGLVRGINTIEIDVWNGTFQEPSDLRDSPVNPMALRVEWYAFGRQTI